MGSVEEATQTAIVIFIFLLVIGFVWLVLFISHKLLGIILIILGILIMRYIPDIMDQYQEKQFSITFIVTGAIMLLAGIALLIW